MLLLVPLWGLALSWTTLLSWGQHTGRWDVLVYALIVALPLRYVLFPGLLVATAGFGAGLLLARRWLVGVLMLASAACTGWSVYAMP